MINLNVKKISSTDRITYHDFDPDATTPTDVGWVPVRDVRQWMFTVLRTVGTSALVMTILGNSEADGSGTDVTVKSKTFTAGQPDAFLDSVILECLDEEICKAGEDDGVDVVAVSVNLTAATGTDEAIVIYHGQASRFQYDGLTADVIST